MTFREPTIIASYNKGILNYNVATSDGKERTSTYTMNIVSYYTSFSRMFIAAKVDGGANFYVIGDSYYGDSMSVYLHHVKFLNGNIIDIETDGTIFYIKYTNRSVTYDPLTNVVSLYRGKIPTVSKSSISCSSNVSVYEYGDGNLFIYYGITDNYIVTYNKIPYVIFRYHQGEYGVCFRDGEEIYIAPFEGYSSPTDITFVSNIRVMSNFFVVNDTYIVIPMEVLKQELNFMYYHIRTDIMLLGIKKGVFGILDVSYLK